MESALPLASRRLRTPARSGHHDVWLLLLLAIPSALVDWRIAQTWEWPGWATVSWLGATTAVLVLAIVKRRSRELAGPAIAASLYAVPILGAMVRWHLIPSSRTLIGDGALQIQIARHVLLAGTDPYGFNYDGTGLERAPWAQPFPNPALHHLDYWPGTVVLPLPIQAAWQWVLGWWDERILLLGGAVVAWFLLRIIIPGTAGRLAALALFLVPGHTLLAVLGDNDLPMLCLLFAAIFLVGGRRFILGAFFLGLAVATKQTALVAVPPIVAWAVACGADRRIVLKSAAVSLATVLALFLPFILWDPAAFFRDTIAYNLAGGQDAYPIQGLGLSTLLLNAGVIRGARDPFPFFLLQAVITIPLWILGWRWIVKRRQPSDVILWAGLALFGFLFVNRFFQPTYALLGTELILIGLLGRSARPRSALVFDSEPAAAVDYPFAS